MIGAGSEGRRLVIRGHRDQFGEIEIFFILIVVVTLHLNVENFIVQKLHFNKPDPKISVFIYKKKGNMKK